MDPKTRTLLRVEIDPETGELDGAAGGGADGPAAGAAAGLHPGQCPSGRGSRRLAHVGPVLARIAGRMPELRRAGLAQPFEDDHLGGDDLDAVAAHALERELARGRPSRRRPHRRPRSGAAPAPARPSALCRTQTCASMPQSTISCARAVERSDDPRLVGAGEMALGVRSAPDRRSAASSATVGPSPSGYCSEARTGTSSRCAASSSRPAAAARPPAASCDRRRETRLRIDQRGAAARRRASIQHTRDYVQTAGDQPVKPSPPGIIDIRPEPLHPRRTGCQEVTS